MINQQDFDDFCALIDTVEGHNEKDCSNYLHHATDLLLSQTPIATIEIAQEARSPYGRSDYIVIADMKNALGQTERHMIFWELKAPQCSLVERDDANSRYRPTKDLVKAETQLLHYVHQARMDGDLQGFWNINFPDNIKAGGVIIGRDQRIVRPGADIHEGRARHSFRIREKSIYDAAGFKVLTWDRIMEFIQP